MPTPMHRLLPCFAVLFAFAQFCAPTSLRAQTVPAQKPTPVLFQTLALGRTVNGLFYELKGKAVPIQANTTTLSNLYETNADRSVAIFRLVPQPDPQIPPKRVPVATLKLGENHPYLLLFTGSSNPNDIVVRPIEDSWEIHPAGTFRVINHSRRGAAVRLGSENRVIASGESFVFATAGQGQDFDFKLASWEEGTWVLRAQAPQSIIPRTRATIIISDPAPSPQDPNPTDLNFVTVFDGKQLTQ